MSILHQVFQFYFFLKQEPNLIWKCCQLQALIGIFKIKEFENVFSEKRDENNNLILKEYV